jgi:hypothetical protein
VTQPNIRFVGGMNVPAVVGRANGTVPLGVLTVEDGRLCLRPRSFAAWMLTDFSVPLDAIAAAFPLRPGLMRFGVGFEMTDGQVAYFWTRHGEDVLRAMALQGVRVDPEPRPASAVWRLRSPRGTTVARPAGVPPVLVRLYPVTAVLSLVILVVLFTTSDTALFRVLLVVVWLIGFYTTTLTWLRSRGKQ